MARLLKGTHSLCWVRSKRCLRLVASALCLMLFLIASLLWFSGWYRDRCEHRIGAIRVSLKTMRRYVQFLREERGCYPDSFAQLRQSLGRSGSANWDRMYVDLTSNRQERVPEYRALNGKGGYYYDPNSGEIRLNLTMPVRQYLYWYRGSYADQIPSQW